MQNTTKRRNRILLIRSGAKTRKFMLYTETSMVVLDEARAPMIEFSKSQRLPHGDVASSQRRGK